MTPYYNYLTVQKYDSNGAKQWDSTGFTLKNLQTSIISNVEASTNGSSIVSWAKGDNIYAFKIDSTGRPFIDYTSITNGNWNDPATWASGVLPNADSHVVINSIVTITADTECYSLEVGPGGQVIVAPGVHFTILH